MKGGIGTNVLRLEDRRFLTGTGRYAADRHVPGMVHAAILRSSDAHALIRRVDSSQAEATEGVVAVFTGKDVGKVGRIPMRLAPRAALKECFQPPIAVDRVRYVGEPVAVVIAVDRYVAEDALELIELETEPLEPVADAWSGRDAAAPQIHPSLGGNVAEHIVMRVGDAEAELAACPCRLQQRLKVQRHTAIPMETRGLLAMHDKGTDVLTVWGAAKVPHFNRQILAELLGRPESTVRMVEADVGGGFGPRGEFYPEDFLIPWCAIRTGRPVQWVEDRREHLMATNHSREQAHDVEVGFDRDGRIRAIVLRGVVDMGAYVRTNGFVVPERSAAFIPGPYHVRHYLGEVDCVMTNKTPTGSYRGPGRYEASFVRERIVDLVARHLGMDPADVRRRNFVQSEQLPYNVGTTAFGHDIVYDSGNYPDLFERALARIDYASLRDLQKRARAEGRLVGIGLASFVEKSGVGPWESARIRFDGSGRIEVLTGVTSVGQGVETVLAQICAEQFQVAPQEIAVRHGDTDLIPLGRGAYGSRGTSTGGAALWAAMAKLKAKMLDLAGHRLEVDPGMLEIAAGKVVVPGTDLSLSFRELAQAAMPGQDMPEGMEPGLDETAYCVVEHTSHPYGTHVVVVEVEPVLGTVRLLKYLIAYDIGRAVNPTLVKGQLVGGLAQGVGGALLEELSYSEDAQLLTGSLADYLLPTSMEVPDEVDVLLLEDAPSPHNALGVKGAGEGGIVGAGAAIANAVEDALSGFGVTIDRLPLTPDRIAALVRSAAAPAADATHLG